MGRRSPGQLKWQITPEVELAGGARVAQVMAKRAIDTAAETSLAEGLEQESSAFVSVFGTDDARIGVDSFLEHGPGRARFTGR